MTESLPYRRCLLCSVILVSVFTLSLFGQASCTGTLSRSENSPDARADAAKDARPSDGGLDRALDQDQSSLVDQRTAVDHSSGEPAENPCAGVTCSGHGSCTVTSSGAAACDCASGFHASGLTCVADDTCAGKDCGRCGTCAVVSGVATCQCPTNFKRRSGFGCVPDPDPCATVTCGVDSVCVPEAHCAPYGQCVPTCDCSNCGNCTMNDFQTSITQWCGNPGGTTATMVCNKPCPNSLGCLPYSPGLCWPMEGCYSQ